MTVSTAESLAELPPSLVAKRDQLLQLLASFESCAVALSGGVDSAVLAQAAYWALGDKAVAVTARSASLATGELEQAEALAAQVGIRHQVLDTSEFDNPLYLRNQGDRCYHCKSELYDRLAEFVGKLNVAVICSGANLEDADDYRPGMQAAAERGVRSPLWECQLSKAEIRALAKHWNLSVWDKPAMPCLSSRVAYGEAVTPARLALIDASERWLRERGFAEVRVRYHTGDLARVEVPLSQLPALLELRSELTAQLLALGFRYVTVDLEGFRSGSLNRALTLKSLPILG